MDRKRLEPMGVGGLLDRSFSVYRQHFTTFILLALILFAPLLLLQEVLLNDVGSMPLLVSDDNSSSFEAFLQNRFIDTDEAMTDDIGKLLVYLLLWIPLSILIVYPQLQGATLLVTQAAVYGEATSLKASLKQSFGRFWPMAGSTIVYMLIAVGIMLAFGVAIFLLSMLGIGIGSLFDIDDPNPVVIVILAILAYLLFLVLMILVPGYFLLRWAFFLPVVLVERDGIGIGRSWRLTKGNFWRLVGLYLVLTVIYTIFSGGIQALLMGVFGVSVLGQLLMVLFSCLLTPWMMIVYSLAYLDLKVRHDGTDVEALLTEQTEPAWTATEAGDRP
ncbi:ABC transporter ATP-binding protein [Brevibacillus borstelensis]|uniref:ABC transporter ATP-binding protein n=1 Tax=Brevibacillus borstelensis TaxID=45462 RepID=UPI0030BDED93